MQSRPTARVQALAAVISGVVVAAFAIIGAPPALAYQYSEVCVVNNTSGSIRVIFWVADGTWQGFSDTRVIGQDSQTCKKDSRTTTPDIDVSLRINQPKYTKRGREYYTEFANFFAHNPAVGRPVISGPVQGNSSCTWKTYASTCWYARLGANEHRCLKENGYWLRPSREADSGGAKQFRIQVYDGSADPSAFGC